MKLLLLAVRDPMLTSPVGGAVRVEEELMNLLLPGVLLDAVDEMEEAVEEADEGALVVAAEEEEEGEEVESGLVCVAEALMVLSDTGDCLAGKLVGEAVPGE